MSYTNFLQQLCYTVKKNCCFLALLWGFFFLLSGKELERFEYTVALFWGPSLLTYKMGEKKLPTLIVLQGGMVMLQDRKFMGVNSEMDKLLSTCELSLSQCHLLGRSEKSTLK